MSIKQLGLAVLLLLGCDDDPAAATDADGAVGQGDVGDAALDSRDAVPEFSGPPTLATLGSRCLTHERMGLVTISGGPGGRFTWGEIYDRPLPWIGPPVLTSAACGYHEPDLGCFCDDEAEVCTYDTRCVAAPRILTEFSMTVEAGEETLHLEGGDFMALSTRLAADTGPVALRLRGPGFDIQVPPMSVPPALRNLVAELDGTGGSPATTGDLTLTWTPPSADDTVVWAQIDINHHVGGPTFTECVVDASAGAMEVPSALLAPLAVDTGLEFAGPFHLRFAAADTPFGCLEVRFLRQELVRW